MKEVRDAIHALGGLKPHLKIVKGAKFRGHEVRLMSIDAAASDFAENLGFSRSQKTSNIHAMAFHLAIALVHLGIKEFNQGCLSEALDLFAALTKVRAMIFL